MRPTPGWGVLEEIVVWAGVSADSVELIKSVNTGGAGQSVPLVATTFAPAIDPGLASGWMGKRTHVAGFAMNAMLISAQKGSFHRVTLKSSHRVVPSIVDCYVPSASGEAWQLGNCREGPLPAWRTSTGNDVASLPWVDF